MFNLIIVLGGVLGFGMAVSLVILAYERLTFPGEKECNRDQISILVSVNLLVAVWELICLIFLFSPIAWAFTLWFSPLSVYWGISVTGSFFVILISVKEISEHCQWREKYLDWYEGWMERPPWQLTT